MKEKALTLKFTGYTIKGVSDLNPWGGGNACIEMRPFNVRFISKESLLDNINDNGFGVKSINGAICDIYENFQGYLKYLKTLTVGTVLEHTQLYNEEVI